MALLIVSRPGDKGGRFRQITVLVNNHSVGSLRPNKRWEMRLPAGEYTVGARLDWVTSPRLPIHLDDEVPTRVEISLPLVAVLRGIVAPRGAIRVQVI
jgi:hypothetical protein